MVLPLPVKDLQEEVSLQEPHRLGTELGLPGSVGLPGKGQEPLLDGIDVSLERVHRGPESENGLETVRQPVQIPLVTMGLGIDVEPG